jgi:hypothetical protein
MPEFNGMGSGESKAAAEQDFQARIGEPGAATVSGSQDDMVEFIVSAKEGSGRQVTQDIYPSYLSPGISLQKVETALQQQFSQLGVTKSLLGVHSALPLGTLSKINTAVLRVPESQSASLMNALQTLGLDVQIGRTFSLPKPMEAEPSARTVGLKEMAKVIGVDKLQAELRKALGDPTPPAPAAQTEKSKPSILSAVGDLFRRMARAAPVVNPVLPWALLDSWSFVDHPFMKGHFIKSVANDDDGESHGTHTGGTVVGMDPWNFHGRNYNIFPKGSATESDILFKLNMAQQDGALATTNSWGDGSGNPAGAIEKLFAKTAAEGVHHSVSAGNAGPSKNTIGGPAIMTYEVDLVINGKVIGKVKRIKAIAASDADKKTASFSSRGKGSRTTSRKPEYKDWPQKPDESGVGVNLVAPVPKGKVVEELGGPGASLSGTSMSNPGVFGAFLLLTRGILVLLKDDLPKLAQKELTLLAMDLARYSMTQTALKVAPVDEVGDGFIDVWAAYEHAAKLLKDSAPAPAPQTQSVLSAAAPAGAEAAPTARELRIGAALAGLAVGLPVLALQLTGIWAHYVLTTMLGGGLLSAAVYGHQDWQRSEGRPLKERVLGTAAEAFLAFMFGTAFVSSLVSQWAQSRFGPEVAAWLHQRKAAEPRNLSMKEFGVINGAGVAASIAAGFLMSAPLWGLLGTLVAPIPLLFAYVGMMRLLGIKVNWPKIRFNPSAS